MALDLARKTKNFDHDFLAILYLINTRINVDNVNPQKTLNLTHVAEGISSKLNNHGLLRLKAILLKSLLTTRPKN